MQMPQMAKDVFMGSFIALAGVAVKSLVSAKAPLDRTQSRTETFY
ncbi:hypothetical protein [Mesorhizobium sp. INR15]|nr:hypothetical protein [Mesorhizobium sp. INR15]